MKESPLDSDRLYRAKEACLRLNMRISCSRPGVEVVVLYVLQCDEIGRTAGN